VVGVYLCWGSGSQLIQLVWPDVSARSILNAVGGASILYTYNGSRFDLPFIDCRVGLDLGRLFEHRDLMYDCWRNNLYGGFKAVERQLGITRKLPEVNGHEAVRLWWKYVKEHDSSALATLLEYNKEDVINLKVLKGILAVD
jgi:hypothetical protein